MCVTRWLNGNSSDGLSVIKRDDLMLNRFLLPGLTKAHAVPAAVTYTSQRIPPSVFLIHVCFMKSCPFSTMIVIYD